MTKSTISMSLALLAGTFVFAGAATAEEFGHHGGHHAGLYGYGYNYDNGWHASTVGESWARGRAAIIRSAGEYNLDTSKANINNQEAYSMALDNHLKKIDTYYAGRDKSRQYRAAERGPQPSTEAMYQYSRARLPNRATSYQVEPVFGTINWPAIFEGPQFDASRKQMDDLYRDRDTANLATGGIARTAASMEQELKGMINTLTPDQYIGAKNFLKTLAYEARFAPDVQGVASR
jgi:hypothetical protein